ncbi:MULTISPECIES: MarR family winged helix-turn-helix transcriptional regulator [Streptomyces]|nr:MULTISPECIES: MarR family transcriptional regulator [Streptomyces]WTI25106.1 MarR family transcriptional regulator [Streptomyces jietaisiensis]
MDMSTAHSEKSHGATEDLVVAVEQVLRHVRQSATAGGLGIAASALLGRLSREGPLRLTELARAEGISQPNATQLVTRMERAGLVRRTADRSDGRGVLVTVTETGLDVFARRRAERARALGELMAELSEPERRATELALSALARVIRERQQPERG